MIKNILTIVLGLVVLATLGLGAVGAKYDGDIGQMRAAVPGAVQHPGIAGADGALGAVDHHLHRV